MSTGIHYERCRAALEGAALDRPPMIGGWITQEDVLVRMSGVTRDEFWSDPRHHAIAAYRALGVDVMVQFVLPKEPERATKGSGGRATNFTASSRDPSDEFPDVESVIRFIREYPTPAEIHRSFNRSKAYYDYLKTVNTGAHDMQPMVWVPGHICGCPSFMWYSRFGYENYFEAMLEAPEAFSDFFASLAEERRLLNAEVARATSDHDLLPLVYCGEDICFSDGPMCSPRLLDEIYFPHLKRAFEPLKDSAIRIVWHSDGNIMPIIDQLIASGVDGYQGLEEDHGMDLATVAAMKNRDGDPLILWGSVSVTSTLPFGSTTDVEADVKRCIDIGSRTRRFFLAPSSSVGPEVSTENILAMYRTGVEYGLQV